jgi:ABC-type uncharacterized transport system ATPase subunit
LQSVPPDLQTSAASVRRRAVVASPVVDYAVEAYSLKKVYRTRGGKRAAVDGLDLRVPVGGVHGFLGPNGSGKTTTIRMLLGLITADSGHIRIFDHEVPLAINQIIDRRRRRAAQVLSGVFWSEEPGAYRPRDWRTASPR